MSENLIEDDNPPITSDKDYYSELVGEGKKFKDSQTLARSKVESDTYIKVLEKRLDEMRNDYLDIKKESTTSKRLEDLIDQLSRTPNSAAPQRTEGYSQPTLDPKLVESLVDARIQERDSVKQQEENQRSVEDQLKRRYGESYEAKVKEQISDLGISPKEFNDLARRQPKVLIRTMGLDRQQTEPFQAPPTPSRRNDSFSPTSGNEERTWTYYKKLRAENKEAWNDRKIAVQMQQDALRLGEKFCDGDFYAKGLHESNN